MIGSLRKKFISISIVSILVVFSGIFFFLLIFTRMQTNRSLDLLTDTISSNDGIFPRFDPSKHHLPIQLLYSDIMAEETRFSTRFFPFGWMINRKLSISIWMLFLRLQNRMWKAT